MKFVAHMASSHCGASDQPAISFGNYAHLISALYACELISEPFGFGFKCLPLVKDNSKVRINFSFVDKSVCKFKTSVEILPPNCSKSYVLSVLCSNLFVDLSCLQSSGFS